MEFCSLFSGSSGNSLLIKDKETMILCDAGKNGKQVELALKKIGEDAADLDAIILTHEHIDHVAAAGVLSRRYDIPIYANADTWEKLYSLNIGKIQSKNEKVFEVYSPFNIKNLSINSFRISHDAVDPVGFKITDGHSRLGIATDTGIVTDDMFENLSGCNLIVLESNHDINMLETGSYPYRLKQRIKSAWGHLSNNRAAEFAKELVKTGTEDIVFAHLSRENNMPFLVQQEVQNVFEKNLIKIEKDVLIEVAQRNQVSSIHHF